jgi:hypothetical protein
LLAEHWSPVVAQCRPDALARIEPEDRMGTSGRNLLAQCEALLRLLLRRRRRYLRLVPTDVARTIQSFDAHRVQAVGDVMTLAYLLVCMHWCGCRHPLALVRAPLHPPTGLVRWLAEFTVTQQVDNGRQLLDRLVLEEARVFDFARRLIERISAMSLSPQRGVVLLPELLTESK